MGRVEASAHESDEAAELLVIMGRRGYTCTSCGADHDPGAMLIMEPPGPVCLACAERRERLEETLRGRRPAPR